MKSTRARPKEIKVYLQGVFEKFYSVCVNGCGFHNIIDHRHFLQLCIAFDLDDHKYDFYELSFI